MAFNLRPGGKASSVPVPEGTESGHAVVVGDLAGIAEAVYPDFEDGGSYATIALEGVASLATADDIALGDAVYVPTAGGPTAGATGAKAIGISTRRSEAGPVWFTLVQHGGWNQSWVRM